MSKSKDDNYNNVSNNIFDSGTKLPRAEEMLDLNYKSSTYECNHLIEPLKGRTNCKRMKETKEENRAHFWMEFEWIWLREGTVFGLFDREITGDVAYCNLQQLVSHSPPSS